MNYNRIFISFLLQAFNFFFNSQQKHRVVIVLFAFLLFSRENISLRAISFQNRLLQMSIVFASTRIIKRPFELSYELHASAWRLVAYRYCPRLNFCYVAQSDVLSLNALKISFDTR